MTHTIRGGVIARAMIREVLVREGRASPVAPHENRWAKEGTRPVGELDMTIPGLTPRSKKHPPDIPERGERARLRGDKSATGTLRSYEEDTNSWARVDWDEGVVAPLFCHRFELERINSPPAPSQAGT